MPRQVLRQRLPPSAGSGRAAPSRRCSVTRRACGGPKSGRATHGHGGRWLTTGIQVPSTVMTPPGPGGGRRARRQHRPARLQREGAPARGDRPHPGGDGRVGVLLRDHRHRRRLERRIRRGRCAQIEGIRLIQFGTNRGSGSARKYGTQRLAGPRRRVDRRRHDLPERPHPRAGRGAGAATTRSSAPAPPRRAPTRRSGCRPSGSSASWRPTWPQTPIPDLNSGLRAFRRDVALQYVSQLPAGFSCVTTHHDDLPGPRLHGEVLADRVPRAGRRSKFHWWRDTRRYLLQVVRMIAVVQPAAACSSRSACCSASSAAASWPSTASPTTSRSPSTRC